MSKDCFALCRQVRAPQCGHFLFLFRSIDTGHTILGWFVQVQIVRGKVWCLDSALSTVRTRLLCPVEMNSERGACCSATDLTRHQRCVPATLLSCICGILHLAVGHIKISRNCWFRCFPDVYMPVVRFSLDADGGVECIV